jgi:hypothetical protein
MTWVRGQQTIRRLIGEGKLVQVQPAPAVTERLLHDADAHVDTLGRRGIDNRADPQDPTVAFQLADDAARKASAALLAVQVRRFV